MKRIVALVAVAGILGMVWCLLRPGSRRARAVVSPSTEMHEPDSEVELVQPRPPASGSEPGGAVFLREEEVAPRRSQIAPGRSAAPERATVHGQLFVAESGDPIREVLSVRLRTLDLEHKEDVLTQSDGSFTSVKSYASGVLLARVRNRDGRELVDHEAYFDPASAERWTVPVPSRKYPTSVRGTVVDRRGDPLDEVSVRLVPLGSALPWRETLSDEHGRFELEDLRGGSYRLHLQGIWQRGEPLELLLHAGANELGNLALDEPGSAGLFVRFVCAGDAGFPAALVVVQPATLPREVAFYSFGAEEHGRGIFQLRVPRVPAGECTLKIEGLDGRAYEPELAVVGVPGSLEVRVTGEPGPMRCLRARDAGTGEPITAFKAWKRCHGVWGPGSSNRSGESKGDLFLLGADAWVVLAGPYRGMRGSNVPDDDGIIDVELQEIGWSALLVFEDAEGDTRGNPDFGRNRPLLADVEVFTDGRFAGTSDGEGMLLLSGERSPQELAFHLQGWHVVQESSSAGVPRSGSVHQVWMLRER